MLSNVQLSVYALSLSRTEILFGLDYAFVLRRNQISFQRLVCFKVQKLVFLSLIPFDIDPTNNCYISEVCFHFHFLYRYLGTCGKLLNFKISINFFHYKSNYYTESIWYYYLELFIF